MVCTMVLSCLVVRQTTLNWGLRKGNICSLWNKPTWWQHVQWVQTATWPQYCSRTEDAEMEMIQTCVMQLEIKKVVKERIFCRKIQLYHLHLPSPIWDKRMKCWGNELNACLSRGAFSQTERCQQAVMRILDSMNGAQPLTRATRMHLFQRLGDRVERLADQNRIFCESTIGQRYQQNANQLGKWFLRTEFLWKAVMAFTQLCGTSCKGGAKCLEWMWVQWALKSKEECKAFAIALMIGSMTIAQGWNAQTEKSV